MRILYQSAITKTKSTLRDPQLFSISLSLSLWSKLSLWFDHLRVKLVDK